jgi:diguanylate cyclase (GGDEF)-like protein
MEKDLRSTRTGVYLHAPQQTKARILRKFLAHHGWDVHRGQQVEDLVGRVKETHSDLVILHVSQEETLAPDLREAIATLSSLNVPTLLMVPAGADRGDYLDVGVDDVMDPRIDPEELIGRLQVLLRMKAKCDELRATQAQVVEILRHSQDTINALQADNARLEELCLTDPLTGLCNVRSFHQMLGQAFRVAKRYNHPTSLLMLDLDHFTAVNNQYGHPGGDNVLRELGDVLRESVRESDVIARLGGEEFTVLLPQTDSDQAHKLAERIRSAVAIRTFDAFGHDVRMTISIGAATWPRCPEISDPEMLLYFADQALLNAKSDGRNRIVCVSEMDVNVRRQMWRDYRRQASSESLRVRSSVGRDSTNTPPRPYSDILSVW